MSALAKAITREFERARPELPGHDRPWLTRLRDDAFARFSATGFPSLREEDWKYTDLSGVTGLELTYAPAPGLAATDAAALELRSIAPLTVVAVNGRLDDAASDLDAIPAGLTVVDLAGALAAADATAEEALVALATRAPGCFENLNTAFLHDAVFVHVARGAQIEAPLHVMHVSDHRDGESWSASRVIVQVEEGASLELVESFQSIGGDTDDSSGGLHSTVCQIHAAAAARVTHTRVQAESRSATHVGRCHVVAGRDAVVRTASFAFGADLSRVDVQADLEAPGAEVALDGLFMPGTGQHMDHHTAIRHLAPHTTSSEDYKGIAGGTGRGVFNGKIYVERHAQKIAARQSSHNLLVGISAEIDTKPELEIYADDVTCAHGATVGQMSHDELFYLRSRGIAKADAEAILTLAFAREIVDRVDNEPLRTWLADKVSGRTLSAD